MKKDSLRNRSIQKQVQRRTLKRRIIAATCISSFTVLLAAVFDISSYFETRASDKSLIDIRPMKNQVFLNEMNIPEAVISVSEPATANTIFVRHVNTITDSVSPAYE
jgi:hypothetical protein